MTRHSAPRSPLLLALALLALAAMALGGCKSNQPGNDTFVVLAERDFPGTRFDLMFTLAQRTMRDLRLARRTVSKNERDAMLIFLVPEANYGEMAFQIRPEGSVSSHVTLLGKPLRVARDQVQIDRIMDDLAWQIKVDKDPLLSRPKPAPR